MHQVVLGGEARKNIALSRYNENAISIAVDSKAVILQRFFFGAGVRFRTLPS
jgi:hypothetical protein